MGFVKMVQFVGPIAGILLSVASFSSEHWILTEHLYRWGLFSKCEPENGNTNASVTCVYVKPGQSPGYFEAAQALSSISMAMYAVLQFHFIFIGLRILYHQLPAAISVVITVLIAIVVLMVGVSYSSDSRWTHLDPSLGWSYWTGVAAAACSFLTSAVFIYRGYEEYRKPKKDKRNNQVHPRSRDRKGDGVPGEERGTQSSVPQTSTGAEQQYPDRKWKRRLSPILERSQLPVVPETEGEGSVDGVPSAASATVHAYE